MKNKQCICTSCKWRDMYNAQCYDGHLQMSGKKECEGHEGCERSFLSAKIMFEIQERKND